MSISRGMDKVEQDIYIMEYYSALKKEQNWVICRDMDKPRDCHTHINAYMWNLEKWYG